jgi:hypothetical protein
MDPAVGLISFAMRREVVVFPQPDSPTSPTHSPAVRHRRGGHEI